MRWGGGVGRYGSRGGGRHAAANYGNFERNKKSRNLCKLVNYLLIDAQHHSMPSSQHPNTLTRSHPQANIKPLHGFGICVLHPSKYRSHQRAMHVAGWWYPERRWRSGFASGFHPENAGSIPVRRSTFPKPSIVLTCKHLTIRQAAVCLPLNTMNWCQPTTCRQP